MAGIALSSENIVGFRKNGIIGEHATLIQVVTCSGIAVSGIAALVVYELWRRLEVCNDIPISPNAQHSKECTPM